METLSLSEAKMKLSELIEKVQSTDAEVVITKNGRPAAVLVSPDEFEGWRETIAIKADGDLMSVVIDCAQIVPFKVKYFQTVPNEIKNSLKN